LVVEDVMQSLVVEDVMPILTPLLLTISCTTGAEVSAALCCVHSFLGGAMCSGVCVLHLHQT
jgi:hypothetical protein